MKNDKKNKTSNSRRVSDFDALNSQLGSFDLEPPKRYRDDANSHRTSRQMQNNGKKRPTQRNERKRASSVDNNHIRRTNPNQRNSDVHNDIKNRKKKNKKLKIIRAVAVIIAVVIVFIILSLTVIFKINTITITGNTKYSNDEILSALSIEKEDNLFLADIAGIEENLEQSLPYIYDVQIKRKLPTTITVKITEVSQIYSIKNQDKSYTLLDKNLKVLECNTAKLPENSILIDKLTLLSATPGQIAEIEKEQQNKDLLAICECIDKLKLDKITQISSYQVNSNTMMYDDRITIRLGTTEEIEDKIYASLTAIEKLNETNPGAHGDLTVLDDKQVYFTEK